MVQALSIICLLCSICASIACTSRVQYVPPTSSSDAAALNINTASIEELEKLPYIGRKTAESIVAFREQNGPFRRTEHLMLIPVVMLTTSDSEKDIFESYQSHANCYITKPVNFENFMDVIQTIKDFWINIVQLPKLKEE